MATFTVTGSGDTINPNDGVITLREAINFAANNPGRDRATYVSQENDIAFLRYVKSAPLVGT
ncbi:MAG: hypothetical protein HC789_22925 [Microcoleus sp. CSU_2_2]|nr:hypothetical protein [Microcoleus sp. SU_5_3]NJS13015.1 hypothetical protein [Microcoleus sp. CSU_2_2]